MSNPIINTALPINSFAFSFLSFHSSKMNLETFVICKMLTTMEILDHCYQTFKPLPTATQLAKEVTRLWGKFLVEKIISDATGSVARSFYLNKYKQYLEVQAFTYGVNCLMQAPPNFSS